MSLSLNSCGLATAKLHAKISVTLLKTKMAQMTAFPLSRVWFHFIKCVNVKLTKLQTNFLAIFLNPVQSPNWFICPFYLRIVIIYKRANSWWGLLSFFPFLFHIPQRLNHCRRFINFSICKREGGGKHTKNMSFAVWCLMAPLTGSPLCGGQLAFSSLLLPPPSQPAQ